MTSSKSIVSSIATAAFVTAVGFAYAQSSTDTSSAPTEPNAVTPSQIPDTPRSVLDTASPPSATTDNMTAQNTQGATPSAPMTTTNPATTPASPSNAIGTPGTTPAASENMGTERMARADRN